MNNNDSKYLEYLHFEYEKMRDYLSPYIDIRNNSRFKVGGLKNDFYGGLFIVNKKWFVYSTDDYFRHCIKGPFSFEGAAYFFLKLFSIKNNIDINTISSQDKQNYMHNFFSSLEEVVDFEVTNDSQGVSQTPLNLKNK